MKRKKVKLRGIMAALVVVIIAATAMTGSVAAVEEELESCNADGTPKLTFYKGERIYVTDKAGVPLAPHGITGKVWIVENLNWGTGHNGRDLSAYSYHDDTLVGGPFPDVFVSGIGVNASGKFIGTAVSNGIVDICAVTDLSGTYPDSYDIVYDADGDGYYNCTASDCPDKVDRLTCNGFKTEIPEFVTIAIPAAAILGLVFFLNHRRRKK